MRTTPLRVTIGAVSLIAALFAGTAAAPAAGQQSYIVVLDAGTQNVAAVAADLAKPHGGQVGYVYQHALKGFSITVGPGGAAAIARNPQVAYVEADPIVSIAAQTTPTGIERIFTNENPNVTIDGTNDAIDVDVAVIDTGIDLDHPDLNVFASTNCSGGSPFRQSCGSGGDDDNGHGTHVAGTIGALDNDIGVVGVAPGARLWSVKVLRSDGSGYLSWIIAGIDYVTANASSIEVANMSLGGSFSNQAFDDAIANSVKAGVAYAVAAGNSDSDASGFSPANHPDVLTVSALADFDGKPGALGSPTCRTDQDDTLADFSNWGSLVEIAAPGVCILSTWLNGGYNTISGTSMASPHAAGALGLLAVSSNPSDAAGVKSLYKALIDTGNFCWTDDSGDGIQEPLLDLRAASVSRDCDGDGGGGGEENSPPTASFTFSCTDLACDFTDTSTDSDGTINSWSWDFDGDGVVDSSAQNPTHTYGAGGTYPVTLTVTDDDGATGTSSQNVSVSEPSDATITLSVSTYKIRGIQHADLTWSGATSTSVDIYRDGSVIATTANDGAYTDNLGTRGGGSATYQVCEAGTSTCSDLVSGSW